MNSDLSSTESVPDNLENIPEIEVAFFHEGFLLLFCVFLIYNDTTICRILSSVYLVVSRQLSVVSSHRNHGLKPPLTQGCLVFLDESVDGNVEWKWVYRGQYLDIVT